MSQKYLTEYVNAWNFIKEDQVDIISLSFGLYS